MALSAGPDVVLVEGIESPGSSSKADADADVDVANKRSAEPHAPHSHPHAHACASTSALVGFTRHLSEGDLLSADEVSRVAAEFAWPGSLR